MKTHQAILLNLLCVLLIFINPLAVFAGTSSPVAQAVTTHSAPAKKIKTHKTKKHATAENISTTAKPKTLDLSVSFTEPKQSDTDDNENQAQSLFVQARQNNQQPVQLSGDVLMSAEPEAEKKKSVEGAGIFINLKP